MNNEMRQLVGRLSAIEILLIQTLGMTAGRSANRAELFTALRNSFDGQARTLPDDIRAYASDIADRVFSRAEGIAERWPALH